MDPTRIWWNSGQSYFKWLTQLTILFRSIFLLLLSYLFTLSTSRQQSKYKMLRKKSYKKSMVCGSNRAVINLVIVQPPCLSTCTYMPISRADRATGSVAAWAHCLQARTAVKVQHNSDVTEAISGCFQEYLPLHEMHPKLWRCNKL